MSLLDRFTEWKSRSDGKPATTNEGRGDEDGEEEYDGPRLGEMIKFSVLVGPEGGIGAWPAEEGAIYVTPKTAYQHRNGEWVDLEADTRELFRAIATYVDPEEYRRRQQR